mmetsp:Transcript_21129/g.36343  ORF Transcript_21129/g.36343 Transcript_21129/m.36343 type:complete len:97 (+) Transcript_21129:1-291(+)
MEQESHQQEGKTAAVVLPYCCSVEIRFPTPETALIAKTSLEVDEELQPEKVTKSFCLDGPILTVLFEAVEPRLLRVALSSFYDMSGVVIRTLQEFS